MKACVLTFHVYIERTQKLRKNETQLFISTIISFHGICKQTLANWIKTVLCKSGIDVINSHLKVHEVQQSVLQNSIMYQFMSFSNQQAGHQVVYSEFIFFRNTLLLIRVNLLKKAFKNSLVIVL